MSTSTTKGGHAIAHLVTRSGEVHAPADEVLPSEPLAHADATIFGRAERHMPDDRSGEDRFERSRERFELIVETLGGEQSNGLKHTDLQSSLRATVVSCCARCFRIISIFALSGSGALTVSRTARVVRASSAITAGRLRACSRGHAHTLAYRRRGEELSHVADGALNLPIERASHGVRRLAAI